MANTEGDFHIVAPHDPDDPGHSTLLHLEPGQTQAAEITFNGGAGDDLAVLHDGHGHSHDAGHADAHHLAGHDAHAWVDTDIVH